MQAPDSGSILVATRRMNRRTTWLLFAAAFLLAYLVERWYFSVGTFRQYNVLFDSDPNVYLAFFAHGRGALSFRHPLRAWLFSTPIRALADLLAALLPADALAIREQLALLVVPLFQGGKSILLAGGLRLLGCAPGVTSLVVLLNLVGLSALTLGSIPETFPVSAFFIMLVSWFAIQELGGRPIPWAGWIGAGVLGTGVTLTNVVPWGIALVVALGLGRNRSWAMILWQAGLATAAAGVLCFALAMTGTVVYGQDPGELIPRRDRGDLGRQRSPVPPVTDQLVAAANTFAGVVPPGVVPNARALAAAVSRQAADDPGRKPRLFFSFTYRSPEPRGPAVGLWTTMWLALLAVGSYGLWRGGRRARGILIVSGATLLFNVVVHRRFGGSEAYLYVLHWQVPMLFMLAGLGRLPGGIGPAILGALCVLSLLSAGQFFGSFRAALDHALFAPR